MGEPNLKDYKPLEINYSESSIGSEYVSDINSERASSDAFLKFNPKFDQLTRTRQRQAFRVTLMMAFLAIVTIYSELGKLIEESVSAPIEFKLRSNLGFEPKVSPRLKILAIDDAAVNFYKKTNLSLPEWAKILRYVDSHQPKVIYIDKIFGIGYGNSREDVAALEELKKLKSEVYIGSFISQSKNSYREPLPEILEKNRIKDPEQNERQYSYIFDLREKKYIAYGPEKILLDVFQIAHIDFSSTLSFSPILRHSESNLIFHLGIAGQDIRLENNFIKVGQGKAPVSRDKILINFLDYRKNFRSLAKSMAGLERRIAQKVMWNDFLKKEDHVLILPEAFTGSADFKQSPFGAILGGWHIASVINSALTGQWLTRFDSVSVLILSVFLMGLFSTYTRARITWAVIAASIFLIPILGISLFTLTSIVTPWLLTTFFVSITGISVLAIRAQMDKEKEKILESMLIESSLTQKDNEDFSRKTKVFEREKREAAAIASAFLPDPLPHWPGIEISGFHRFIDAASGDWFFFETSDDKKLFHVVLCDITGHGVQAALIVSTCKTVLNSFRKYQPQAKNSLDFITQYIENLNEILFIQGHGNHTCTLIAMTLEPGLSRFHLITCGHPPALLIKNEHIEKRPELLRTRFNPLGYQQYLGVSVRTLNWEIGDQIIINTDGIPLSENLRSVVQFMRENSQFSKDTAAQLSTFIWNKLKAKGKSGPDDDISLLIMKRTIN